MRLKKLIAVSLTAVMMTMSLAGCGDSGKSSSQAAKPHVRPTRTPTPAGQQATATPTISLEPVYDYNGSDKVGDLTGMTSKEISAQMGFGINIGNTFDATGGQPGNVLSHESSWGNPAVTQEYVDALYEAGFRTVRIPTTWANYIKNDNGTYTIYQAYINRVREAVDYCYQHDMFVILNVHHEDWVNHKDLVTKKDALGDELSQVWTQIADAFADYDQHLIFETMNEPRLAGTDLEWSGNPEAYEAINYFNQLAVKAIRSTNKGHNDERCIMIPQYAASNSPNILASLNIPTVDGNPVKNIMISVHSYTPYDFCLSDNKKTFDPDKASDTSGIDSMFANLKKEFLDNDIPVVIGETSATNSGDNHDERAKWAGYMGKMAASFGVPIVLWDNGSGGSSGGECHEYINRRDYSNPHPEVLEAMFSALTKVEWGSFSELGTSAGSGSGEGDKPQESLVGGRVIVSYPDGHTSEKEWDNGYIMVGASEGFFAGGKDIYIAYKGEGHPVMVLDSEALQQWWMPVDPSETTEMNGMKVQIYKAADIKKVLDSFGVTAYSQLRNLCFVAADGTVTAYEVASVGDGHCVSYRVNGTSYYTGTEGDAPADPVVEGYDFLGWYTTKDYRDGTEYKPGALEDDITVYAKLALKK